MSEELGTTQVATSTCAGVRLTGPFEALCEEGCLSTTISRLLDSAVARQVCTLAVAD